MIGATMTETTQDDPARSSGSPAPRLGVALALLAMAQLIFSLDINIVFVALPEIGARLDFSPQSLQWVVGAYAVFSGGFLLLGGRAADLLGRRRVFIAALALYAIGSLAGGLAANAATIVAARAVQGIGGALLLPSTLALIGSLFAEGPPRNRALAVWGGAGASGLTLGALLGGILTQAFGWPAVFFVNVPLAAIVIVGALRFIPRDELRHVARQFDVFGAVAGTLAALALVFAIVEGPISGWASVNVWGALLMAVVAAIAFTNIERRSADPLIAPDLVRNRSLLSAAAITFVYMGTFGALPYFLTELFQQIRGLSALQTGLIFLIPSIAIASGTQAGERIVNRIGARRTLLLGFSVGIPGTALLAIAFQSDSGIGTAVPGLLISGFGQGIVWTSMWVAAATGVHHGQQGVANGLASTTLSLGNAIGLAALTALAAASTRDAASPSHGALIAVLAAAAAMLLGIAASRGVPKKALTD
jgi:MFS family permease